MSTAFASAVKAFDYIKKVYLYLIPLSFGKQLMNIFDHFAIFFIFLFFNTLAQPEMYSELDEDQLRSRTFSIFMHVYVW